VLHHERATDGDVLHHERATDGDVFPRIYLLKKKRRALCAGKRRIGGKQAPRPALIGD
jgi:hypothetical protein